MSADDGHAPLTQVATAAAELQFEELPEDVIEAASRNILDTVGVALAGADEPVTVVVRKALSVQGAAGTGRSRVWGTTSTASAVDAATINGIAAHALDFDDWAPGSGVHPSAPILPAVLAVADEIGSSGADVIAAYVAGYELQERIGLAVGPSHYELGFHTTGTIGTFGAAAAVANLLGADSTQMLTALRTAATQAAGLKAMFGSMGKPLHAGRAAAAGILAAKLAVNGFVASSDSVLGEQGFVATHTRSVDETWLQARFGEPWFVLSARIKSYAACFGTHGAIGAALHLRADPLFDIGTIERIDLDIPRICVGVCTIPEATTVLEAKFSVAFVVAAALVHGSAGVRQFTPDSLSDPVVQRLSQLVHLNPNDWMDKTRTDVGLSYADGRHVSASADAGQLWTDLSDSERLHQVRSKFDTLVAPIITSSGADQLADAILHLAQWPDISAVTAALVPQPSV